MARINIRELPDHIHKAISESAERNNRSTEGEVRSVLQAYVSALEAKPARIETLRESWQRYMGERLDQLFACVRHDQVFTHKEPESVAGIARLIGEDSPANLLDCLGGLASPSFDMLDRVAAWSGASYNWLICGAGSVFATENIGSSYQEFFLHDLHSKSISFRLLRVCGGRSDGMLMCIRHDSSRNTYVTGYIYEHFMLKAGMGSGGNGNLYRFIHFLKTQCGHRSLQAYNYDEIEMNTQQGAHHPLYYIRRATQAEWLRQLFSGEDPSNWLKGNLSLWKDMHNLPFGGEKAE
ncbi:FitA-like ribbon-helix-helix domain-containing protein [Pseudomonas sp. 3-2]|uniref:FitA-like ribbon-helix-helix domain-containing protein n=1 Tax=Pseudomonas sp. 3-2 TaxID=2867408 RepID=UPI001C876DC2|nr:hypothetical protein [Pseudomonas sp. 3-2]QZD72870.1 hypothetical protein K3819_08370 [Pseudomonas sp. 3-2]